MADNTTLNSGSGGDVIGSDDISGVKFQRIKLIHGADGVNAGDISLTNPFPVQVRHANPVYRFMSGLSAAGSNQVHFDLFNGSGSGRIMRVLSVRAIKDGSTTVTGTVAVKLYLTRTTSVGTGGTGHTENNTTITGVSISELDTNNAALPAQVTGRARPTGGAAGGAVLSTRSVFTEEANAATYEGVEFVNWGTPYDHQPIICRGGEGIRIVQGAVASTGSLDFEVTFELE